MAAYESQVFALLTQHGKERIVAPLFDDVLKAHVRVVSGFDTDTLGTFTRDVPRRGTQLDAARRKARLAIERSGLTLGIGSEGAVAPLVIGSWGVELVVVLDAARELEVIGRAEGPARHVNAMLDSEAALRAFADRHDFPHHGLVLRPDSRDDPRVEKDIDSWEALGDAWLTTIERSSTGRVFAETDLRAHRNPTRRALIGEVIRDVVTRLATECPACATPGFGRLHTKPGLPCRDCGHPTSLTLSELLACSKCDQRVERPSPIVAGDPLWCDRCNP